MPTRHVVTRNGGRTLFVRHFVVLAVGVSIVQLLDNLDLIVDLRSSRTSFTVSLEVVVVIRGPGLLLVSGESTRMMTRCPASHHPRCRVHHNIALTMRSPPRT